MLRRLETTPVKPVTLLAAQLAVYLSATLVAITLVLVLGSVVHDVAVPGNLAAFTLALVLTGLALVAVGLLLAAVAPSIGGATGFGQLLYFPMLFFAGVWLPREAMPDALQRLGDFTPSGAGVAALRDAATGGWPAPLHLLVLAATAGVAGLLAARWFRWA